MTLQAWLPGASQKAETRKQELNKYVKLVEGENYVELALDTEPERIVSKWDSNKRRYLYKTISGKTLEVGEGLHFKLIEALGSLYSKELDLIGKADVAKVIINKIKEDGKTTYTVRWAE